MKKQTRFVLEKDDVGIINILERNFNGVITQDYEKFSNPNRDGLEFDNFMKSLKEGDRIEIKVLKRKK